MKRIGAAIGGAVIGIVIGFFLYPALHFSKETGEARHVPTEDRKADALQLSPVQIERGGIKVATPKPLTISPSIEAQGSILDPAPYVAMSLELESAKATLHASNLEYERTKRLNAQNQNASGRALETAEAAMKRDELLVRSVEAKLNSFFGPAFAGATNRASIMQNLADGKNELARVDYPGVITGEDPSHATVSPLGNEHQLFEADVLGRCAMADPRAQGAAFLLLVEGHGLPINTAILAHLALSGEEIRGFELPQSAITQSGGATVVFISTGENNFRSQPVSIGRSLAGGYFITNGITGNEKVVIAGAQNLLSEMNLGTAEEQ